MAAGTEEGRGRAGPGVKLRGRLREVGWAGAVEGWGVAAQPLLLERRLWLAAGPGQQGPRGLELAFARLSATTGGQSPSASASVLAAAAAAARSRRRRRRAQSPPTRLSERRRRRRQIFSPSLAAGRGACREMQSRVCGAGGRKEEEGSRRGGEERLESLDKK
ncbi:uncharacterized protein LOC113925755 isoform X2 [Zalophus californianus]|uniref:Uncharacterized protein LOC113925755 isoform X2 n=1 Tax=Zalophus californianus TaxID=9704 RepID=A0A6J2DMV4_ZALCA|nr:uncharacterized protein LOC113925755 isoform X2 [Zalophus californianus]